MPLKDTSILDPMNMTADQLDCYRLLCDLVGGEHHVEGPIRRFGSGIKAAISMHQLSTFDQDQLTRLVVMAHDRCIRAAFAPAQVVRLALVLHRRHRREGLIHQRHPEIEDAIKAIRFGKERA